MNREEAKAAGLARFRGEICPHGHRERYSSNGKCVSCTLARAETRDRPKKPRINEPKGKMLGEKVALRKSVPIPKLRVADVVPLLIPMIELKHHQCRYPYDTDRGTLFCALPKMPATPRGEVPSYCPSHFELTHRPYTSKLTVASSLAA